MFVAAGVGAYQDLDLPPAHPRLLQGAAVPRRGLRDPRDVRRAGHPQDGRHLAEDADHLRDDVGRQPGARRDPAFAGYYSKDAILEAASAPVPASAMYGFWCGLIAAALTGVLFLAPADHDLPRQAARRYHTLEHVHESPPVMTVPLMLLAIGALAAGYVWHNEFIGEHWQAFWGDSIRLRREQPRAERIRNMVPGWVSIAPTRAGAVPASPSPTVLYGDADAAGAGSPARSGRSTCSCSTSGISTSSTTPCSCSRRSRCSRTLWQVGDVTIIDGVPNGLADADGRRRRRRGEAADRLDRGLCLRHADRPRRAGQHLPDLPVIP